jgi:hypothetical protein
VLADGNVRGDKGRRMGGCSDGSRMASDVLGLLSTDLSFVGGWVAGWGSPGLRGLVWPLGSG